MKPGMRNDQPAFMDDSRSIKEQVEVQRPWTMAQIVIATQRLLDFAADRQQTAWRDLGLHAHHSI
jgi:hypothetical protein